MGKGNSMDICSKKQTEKEIRDIKDIKGIREYGNIVIYGAGTIAGHVFHCLSGAPFYCLVSAFMVSEKIEGVHELYGVPVIDVREGGKYRENAVILIAVMDRYYEEIVQTLRQEGFRNFVSMTFESRLWEEVRAVYASELWRREGREYLPLKRTLFGMSSDNDAYGSTVYDNVARLSVSVQPCDGVHIYRACSHMDRQIHTDLSEYDWEIPIQVGTELTQTRTSPVCDNQGENISAKKQEYCELTALYWIWKNDTSSYAGLCHYRRHFALNQEMIELLAESHIDVILTVPMLNFPDVRTVYIHDHIEEDWNIMMRAIADLAPDYYETAQVVQNGVYYYAYNMLIARREILNDYCEWLFPILSYCEERCSGGADREHRDSYQNRYIGFLSERLMTVYFLYHEKRYRIVHAGKRFLT